VASGALRGEPQRGRRRCVREVRLEAATTMQAREASSLEQDSIEGWKVLTLGTF